MYGLHYWSSCWSLTFTFSLLPIKAYELDNVTVKPMTFSETWVAFTILGIGVVIAFLILVIEICAL